MTAATDQNQATGPLRQRGLLKRTFVETSLSFPCRSRSFSGTDPGRRGGGQIDTTTGDRRTSNRSACLLVEHQLELTHAVRIRCVHCISMRLHICANKWQLHFVHTGRWARVCQCQRVTTNHPVGAESQQYASRCERDGCA